jgi:hypothetical protein
MSNMFSLSDEIDIDVFKTYHPRCLNDDFQFQCSNRALLFDQKYKWHTFAVFVLFLLLQLIHFQRINHMCNCMTYMSQCITGQFWKTEVAVLSDQVRLVACRNFDIFGDNSSTRPYYRQKLSRALWISKSNRPEDFLRNRFYSK